MFYFILAPKYFRENSDSVITDPHISLIFDKGITTQNLCFFSGEAFKGFEVL